MNSVEDKITRRIYIIIGMVLCFTAIVMYRIERNTLSNKYYLNNTDVLDEDIYAVEEYYGENDHVHEENITDGTDEDEEKDKLVEVKVAKVDISDYTDETYWNVILVNKKQTIPADRPVKLGTLSSGKQLDYRIIDTTEQMIKDAAADGVSLIVCSAYRSYTYQQGLFNREYRECLAKGLTEDAARQMAATEVAYPGTSEHQLGLAIDFITRGYTSLDQGFENTEAFRWLSANAYKYGFILRYQAGKEAITGITYEPWHWRYLGPELAEKVRESGLCYEEFLGKD